MALPAGVAAAIKTLVKAVSKELAKQGIKKGVTEKVALSILRGKIDKTMVTAVAKELGLSAKQIKMVQQGIRLTETRKKLVQGRNFIRNINNYIDNPQKSIKSFIKSQMRGKIDKTVKDVVDDQIENVKKQAVINALRLFEGKLKAIEPHLSLSDNIWDNVDIIDIDDVFEALEYLEVDFYYTSNYNAIHQSDNPAYLDKNHAGYKEGMEEEDFLIMIENMLLKGFHSTPVDGII